MSLDDMERAGLQVERVLPEAEGLRIVRIELASLGSFDVVVVRVADEAGDDDSDLLFYPAGRPTEPPAIDDLSDLRRSRPITSADGLRIVKIERTLPPFEEAVITVADDDAQPMGEVWIFRIRGTGATAVRHEEQPLDLLLYPADLLREDPPAAGSGSLGDL